MLSSIWSKYFSRIFCFQKEQPQIINGMCKAKIIIIILGIKISKHIKSRFKNNSIIVILDNRKKSYSENILKKIYGINIVFNGDNNRVYIRNPKNLNGSNIVFNGNRNSFVLGGDNYGIFNASFYQDNGKIIIRERTKCCSIFISSISNNILIGKDCRISNNVHIWGDGHSVLDYKTKTVINIPQKTIAVGNHVWLGQQVVLTKNACVGDDCIVGIRAVVTKDFSKYQHSLLAGNPAQIKKTGISWDGLEPLNYLKKQQAAENNMIVTNSILNA